MARAPCIFLFGGEGAHADSTDVASLKSSVLWATVETVLQRLGITQDAEAFLRAELGSHAAPRSPIVTTIINLLNEAQWRAAGHQPTVALGHSLGEVAAAYSAGLLNVEDALRTAEILGRLGAMQRGASR